MSMMLKPTTIIGVCCSSLVLFGQLFNCAQAQELRVVPDRTLSSPTQVSEANVGEFQISGGVEVGDNLFHSFREFSIPKGGQAQFSPDGNIQRIFSRVTSTFPSKIEGIIQVQGAADLFLLNPNGIIFGRNAQLDLNGSFVATTAESVHFADGQKFSTGFQPSPPLLTVAMPQGLQFGNTSAAIINQAATVENNGSGGLIIAPNNTLAFIGGSIEFFDGTVLASGNNLAQGGHVELGSVGPGSFVNMMVAPQGWQFSYDGVTTFGDIVLRRSAAAENASVAFSSINASNGGSTTLQGRNISLIEGTIIDVTIGVNSITDGGTLSITASEGVQFTDPGSILISLVGLDREIEGTPEIPFDGGNIIIETPMFFASNNAIVSTATNGEGKAGDIDIKASEVSILGLSILTTSTAGEGDGGDIRIQADQVSIEDGTFFASSFGAGDAGNITLLTNQLLLNAGQLLTTATINSNGGDITLNVADLLQLTNASQITTQAVGMGDGGNIQINAGLVLAFPGQNSDIIANAVMGEGGNIGINTPALFGIALGSTEPVNNPTNDIDASSEAGVDGEIIISTLANDLDSGLVQLPEGITDPSAKIVTGCAATQGNRFVISGRGGLYPNPIKRIRSRQVLWQDLRIPDTLRLTPSGRVTRQSRSSVPQPLVRQPSVPLVEATGWSRNPLGQLALTTQRPSMDSTRQPSTSACHAG